MATAVVVASIVGPERAEANFASDLSGDCYWSQARECYADSSTHDWHADLGPRMMAETRDTLYHSYDTTALTIAERATHTTGVDVHYRHGDLPGPLAMASCQDWSGHRCNHWHVIYDHDSLDGMDNGFLQSVACHETGHTVGLMHPEVNHHGWGANSTRFECMTTRPDFFPVNMGPHNAGHVDGFYG